MVKRLRSFLSVFLAIFVLFGSALPADKSFLITDLNAEAYSDTDYVSEADLKKEFTVYFEDVIFVYNYEQLKLIGTDTVLTDSDAYRDKIGKGNVIEDGGQKIRYSNDAVYSIVQDIFIPRMEVFDLPEGFRGSFLNFGRDGNKLYDAENDIVYINNIYQLKMLGMDDRDLQPLLTGDNKSETFGTGNLVFPDEASEDFVTYSKEHNFVITEYFSYTQDKNIKKSINTQINTETETKAASAEGRDFPGQVVKTLDGKKYILIGNEAQLRAIGSGTAVWSEIYQVDLTLQGYVVDKDNQGKDIVLYGGDADLLQSQNDYKDFDFHVKDSDGLGRYSRGVDQETGQVILSAAANSWNTGQTYSRTANYIVFRDIDLNNVEWTPLMFSGTMYGAKSDTAIWDSTSIVATDRPVISNVLIDQTEDIIVNNYIGIGFFATITNEINVAEVGVSAGTATVNNIELNNVSVSNTSSKAANANTIVSALTSSLGWLVGGLVDGLGALLTIGNVKLSLRDTLSDLLNARTKDPTIFATGAFCGRLIGDAKIINCAVTGTVEVSNTHNYTGGFVGYAEGSTEYSGLSQALGGVTGILSSLLNVIPGLGLGDLITILLDNALPVGDLIPTGYKNPFCLNCEVQGLTGELGGDTYKFVGGFIGQQTGTRIHDSSVSYSNYKIIADTYGGGFAGITRDAQIRGTLTDVGIELMRKMQPQSLLIGCSIENSTTEVTGGQNLGGFTGSLCSSYCVNCEITGSDTDSLTVNGTGSCIAGVAGIATVGWYVNLGKDEITKATLLGTVRELLTGLLSSDTGKAQQLLSLTGVAPSIVEGFVADIGSIDVSAGANYAGGIVGRGDGVYITESSQEYLSEFSFWKYAGLAYPVQRNNDIRKVNTVTANDCYAGGVAGSVGTASITGLLNNTLGVGQFLGFHVSNTSVTGVDSGFYVTVNNNYAGGAFGESVGGEINNTNIYKIKQITGGNRVGGFTGCAGPGDLVGTGGLRLNLLGLDLLQLDNLLALGQGVEVKINESTANGVSSGFDVISTGFNVVDSTVKYTASGFVAKSNSTQIVDSHVTNLNSVQAPDEYGYAGGFVGTSETGGLADVADENSIKDLINVDGLLNAVSYLIPSYTNCDVSYIDGGYVSGDLAGGFVADLESGTVENVLENDREPYVVYNIDRVSGQSYGGGFGAKVVSGALAGASKGLSILGGISDISIDVNGLLGLVNAYIPYVINAGVYSQNGFTVSANAINSEDLNSGSAGGFAGFMNGAQITNSDVNKLKHTEVTPPDNLEAANAPTYYTSSYSVTGGNYAGGYAGKIDIGDAASVGNGLKVLGQSISLTNVLSVLSVVVSTVEHSDVYGAPGGFSVLATGDDTDDGKVGTAGGFTGNLNGGHIQNSNSYNFSYIISEINAGGYVGEMIPGNVADVLGDGSILSSLIDVDSALASLVEDFVPTIRNSETTCIPCGGAVRANAPSDASVQRGTAGGYCGHNEGGHIWGLNTDRWKDESTYSGITRQCSAIRIRSVYGAEYAGGFTGLMESADTAQAGGITLLGGLIKAGNLLNALSFVYPTHENTYVNGPLRELDVNTWNAWVQYVGKYGAMGLDMHTVSNQDELNAIIDKYIFGFNVVAGRTAHVQNLFSEGGSAGGYIGRMISGVITDSNSYDVSTVSAMRFAGGFAGKAETGGLAEFGNVSLLGLNLNLGSLLSALQVFVPVIKSSSITGWKSGLKVIATSDDFVHGCGYAGGYLGGGYGVQVWGDEGSNLGCNVNNLKSVQSLNAAGGFAGMLTAASVADLNTQVSDGFLQQILNAVLDSPGDIASLAQATVSTVRKVNVTPNDENYGFVVKGLSSAPNFAGGFVGSSEAAVIGDRKGNSSIVVSGLNKVEGGLYAGGFVGLADVTGVATVSGNGDNTSSLLSLIQLGQTDVLDAFRTYIYNSAVVGVNEGLSVAADSENSEGLLSETRYTGCAGGFVGGLMNGTITDSAVSNLSNVAGLNYVGGFAGHMGKNGVADIDSASVSNLLGVNAGVLDVFGSQIEGSNVYGINRGFNVFSKQGHEPVAGGFCGFADISRIKNCDVYSLKSVNSDETAGGFVGKTAMHYLVELEADSPLVDLILNVVNELVKLLYVVDLENIGLLNLDIPGLSNILGLKLLSDGDLLYVNLLGLRIGASLVKSDEPGQTDTALITLGDSSIALPATEDGIDMTGANSEVAINLIKGNRTKVTDSTVNAILSGYDVYGGGSEYEKEPVSANGYSGGFVGYNDEGVFENNEMILCDTVRGSSGKIGPFSGYTKLKSVYSFNTLESIEGENNFYCVYRDNDFNQLKTQDNQIINTRTNTEDHYGKIYSVFKTQHLVSPVATYIDWKDAKMTGNDTESELKLYESPTKAVLFSDVKTEIENVSLTPEPARQKDPCEPLMDFTVTKIWDDLSDRDNLRPDNIRIRLIQTGVDSDNQIVVSSHVFTDLPGADSSGWVTITDAESTDNNKWQHIFENIPATETTIDSVTQEENIVYYSYTVEEETVRGYSVSIEYIDDVQAVITNKHRPMLPLTGGLTDYLFILLGFIAVICGLLLNINKNKNKKSKGEKTKMKKILAVTLALAFCVLSAFTAFAAMPTGSLVVSGDELTGKTVTAIRMFTADWVDDASANSSGNINTGDTIAYTLESAWEGLFAPTSTYANKIDVSSYSGDTLSERAVNYISALDANREDTAALAAFAKTAAAYAQAQNLAANSAIAYSAPATNDTATIANLPAGYYLTYPQAGSTSQTRTTDAMLINVPSSEAASWNIKSEYPVVDKTVKNTADASYVNETSAEIGDTVSFKLASKVPEMTNYTNGYAFRFTDTADDGLTIDVNSVVVTIDGVNVTSSFTSALTNGVLTVGINNLRTIADNKVGTDIVVTYNAKVNGNITIGDAGNVNRATVSYSNNPLWDGTGVNPTGTSTEDTASVYSYEIDILKHNEEDVRLAGATFKLLDSSSNEISLVADTSASTANVYRLATPEEIADTNVTKVVAITTPSDSAILGQLKVKGLAEGTYYLEEITPPTGYNKLAAPIQITVAAGTTNVGGTSAKDYTTFTYTVDGTANAAEDTTISVLNTTGPVLPLTGGIGTIILTLVGVGAVIGGVTIFNKKGKKEEVSEG